MTRAALTLLALLVACGTSSPAPASAPAPASPGDVDEPAPPGGSGVPSAEVAPLDPTSDASCSLDTDCVLAAYSCCSAPPCNVAAYRVGQLAALRERCAERVCRPYEPRPCGARPVPDPERRAVCVAGVCQVAFAP